MRDFLGREIKVGDFVAYPGSGNIKAEYGLLLMRVTGFTPKSVKCDRIVKDWNKSGVRFEVASTCIQNQNKLVIVDNVPEIVLAFFTSPQDYQSLLSQWIHGTSEVKW